jgi:hypothetical protein
LLVEDEDVPETHFADPKARGGGDGGNGVGADQEPREVSVEELRHPDDRVFSNFHAYSWSC